MAKDNPRGQLDATARYAIKLSPLDNLRWVAEGLSADLTFSRWIDTQMVAFPGEPRRSCDTVAELKSQSGNEPPWALVIEVEARPKRMTPARMVEYLARLLRKIRYGTEKDPYQVAGAVIVLTGEQKAMKREMVLPGAGMGLAWQIGIVNVSMRNARETLEKIRAGTLGKGILPWIPLMAGAEEPATVSEWGQLALSEVDEEKRKDYGGLARVFASHVNRLGVWDRVLEGWQMSDSPVVQEWIDQGTVKTQRHNLLRLLQLRFQSEPPMDLVEQIQRADQVETLSRWFDAAVLAPTIEAFRVAIRPTPGNGTNTNDL